MTCVCVFVHIYIQLHLGIFLKTVIFYLQFDYVLDAIDTVSGKIALVEKANLYNTPIISAMAYADDETAKFRTIEESLAKSHSYTDIHRTDCASKIFADALKEHSAEISQSDSETDVRMWAKETMHSADVVV